MLQDLRPRVRVHGLARKDVAHRCGDAVARDLADAAIERRQVEELVAVSKPLGRLGRAVYATRADILELLSDSARSLPSAPPSCLAMVVMLGTEHLACQHALRSGASCPGCSSRTCRKSRNHPTSPSSAERRRRRPERPAPRRDGYDGHRGAGPGPRRASVGSDARRQPRREGRLSDRRITAGSGPRRAARWLPGSSPSWRPRGVASRRPRRSPRRCTA